MYSRVYIEITNVCNMNCSFCHGHNRTPLFMTKEQFSYILDCLSGKTEYLYYHLMGEPLLHSEITGYLRIAAKKGLKSQITTNGTLLSSVGDKLLDSPLHKINISVHSFEDGSEKEFSDYIKNIADFSEKASKKGIITVLRLWNNGFDGGRNINILNTLKSEISGEWAENTKGLRIHEKLFLEYGERFEWPDINIESNNENCFCYGLRDHFGILVDGTVVPCCLDSNGVINLGNIFEDNIDNILNSTRAKAIYNGFSCKQAVEPLCKKCGYAQRFIK